MKEKKEREWERHERRKAEKTRRMDRRAKS